MENSTLPSETKVKKLAWEISILVEKLKLAAVDEPDIREIQEAWQSLQYCVHQLQDLQFNMTQPEVNKNDNS